MTALKLIIAEAKKIRKKYPKKEWKDCVKQASAIYSSKHKTKKVGAIKKAAKKKVARKSSYHKDTKSHNVNIRVVSGLKNYNLSAKDFKRIDNDTNGNPRYVIHYVMLSDNYDEALRLAKKIGGKKYHNKKYGGGIAFQSYNIDRTAEQLNQLSNSIGGLDKVVRKGKKTIVKYSRVSGLDKIVRKGKKTNVHYSKVMGIPQYSDMDAAREIELYADNDSKLYFSKKLPILKNLQNKYKKGNYNIEKAAKLWRYYIDDAMQRYTKEYGSKSDKWYNLLSTSDRQLLALEYAKDTLHEFETGNFIAE
jgi:hypothetical protein